MATGDLWYACGFERATLTEDATATATGGTVTTVTTAPHSGARHARINRNSAAQCGFSWGLTPTTGPSPLPGSLNAIALVVWLRFATLPSAKIDVISITHSTRPAAVVSVDQNGAVWLKCSTEVDTGIRVLAGEWNRFELWHDGSTATYKASVAVNGGASTEVTAGSQAAEDVAAVILGTNAGSGAGNYDLYVDDFATFQGYARPPRLCRIGMIVPDSAAAELDTTWTIGAGSGTRAAVIDENPANGTTDYITSSTANQVQRTQMTTFTLASGETVAGIDIRGVAGSTGTATPRDPIIALQSSAGANSATKAWNARLNGLTRVNPYQTSAHVILTDPTSGVAFTQTTLDAARLVMTHDSGTNPNRVTAAWMYVAVLGPIVQAKTGGGRAGGVGGGASIQDFGETGGGQSSGVAGGVSEYVPAPKPFPTAPVLDNFNRGDGAVGAAWTDIFTGGAGGLVETNRVCSDGNGSGYWEARWNAGTFLDSEVYVTFPTAPSGAVIALWARHNGTVDTGSSYALQVNPTTSPDTWQFARLDAGTPSNIGASFSQNVSAGDSLGLRVTGTGTTVTLEAWYKPSGGSWTSLGTRTDSAAGRITAAGYVGISLGGTAVRGDDFGGGAPVLLTVSFDTGVLADEGGSTVTTGGTVTESALAAHDGSSGLRVQRTSAAEVHWAFGHVGGQQFGLGFWFKFASLPTANVGIFKDHFGVANDVEVNCDQTGAVAFQWQNGTPVAVATISAGTWYYLRLKVDSSANPHKVVVAVDSTVMAEQTSAFAAETLLTDHWGNGPYASLNSASNFDLYVDGIVYTSGYALPPLPAGGPATYQKAGGAASSAAVGGADSVEHVEAGGATTAGTAGGARVRERPRSGGALAVALAGGQDAVIYAEAGGVVILGVPGAGDARAFADTGGGRAGTLVGGPDAAVFGDTGGGRAGSLAGAPDAVVLAETGGGTVPAWGGAGRLTDRTHGGGAQAGGRAGGADAVDVVEAGGALAAGLAGADSQKAQAGKAGGAQAGAQAGAADAGAFMETAGAQATATAGAGDATTREEAGGSAAGTLAGAQDAVSYGEAGGGMAAPLAGAQAPVTRSHAGGAQASAQAGGARAWAPVRAGGAVASAVAGAAAVFGANLEPVIHLLARITRRGLHGLLRAMPRPAGSVTRTGPRASVTRVKPPRGTVTRRDG